jgi:PAS domain S-box-containing protein
MAGTDDQKTYLKNRIRAAHTVPLLANSDEMVGVLSVYWSEPHELSDLEFHVTDVLARQTADLIERKQTEEALSKSEKSLAEAQSLARLGSWEWNVATGNIECSVELFDIFGIERGSGKPSLNCLLGFVHPQDLEMVERLIRDLSNGAVPADVEFRIKGSDGETRFVHTTAEVAVADEEGQPALIRGIVQDISERKRFEMELRKGRELLETIFETLPTGIVLSDLRGEITYFSPGAVRIFRGPVTGTAASPAAESYRLLRADGAEFPADELPLVRAVKEAKIISDVEMVVLRGDGSRVTVLASCAPVHDHKDRITGAAAGLQDITAHRLAQEELHESKERFRVLVESASQAVWETDGQGNVVSDSPTWRSYTGQSQDEWKRGWLDAVHPADREAVLGQWKHALATGEDVNIEFRLQSAGGGWRWTNVRAAPILDADGKVLKWVGMNIDITERKQAEQALQESEERFRVMADGSPMIVWVSDARGGNQFVNRAFCEYFGKSPEEVYGLSWQQLIHPDDAPECLKAFQQALGQKASISQIFRVRRHDGEWRWLEVYAKPRFSGTGEFIGMIGTSMDITERRRSEMNLALLAEVSRDFVQFASPDAIMKAVGDRIFRYFQVSARVLFVEVDETNGVAKLIFQTDTTGSDEVRVEWGTSLLDDLRKEKVVAVNDVDNDPRTSSDAESYRACGIRAEILAPRRVRDHTLFVVSVQNSRPTVWRVDEGELLQELAGRIYRRVHHAKAEKALKDSEERYRTLFQSMDEGFCILEKVTGRGGMTDFRFIAANRAFETHMELRNPVGSTVVELFPEIQPEMLEIFEKIAGTGEGVRFEYYCRVLRLWIDAYAFGTDAPSLRRVAFLFKNVTEQKLMERELRESRDELDRRVRERTAELQKAYDTLRKEAEERRILEEHLRQAQKMEAIGTLAGGIAHDFNNLLAVILGNAELALDEVEDESEVQRNLKEILKATSRGGELVKQILTFSRKSRKKRGAVDVVPIIRETYGLLRSSISKNIEMHLEVKPDEGLTIADSTEIQQVMMNLATNAAQAIPEEGGSVTFFLDRKTFNTWDPMPVQNMEPGNYLVLAVTDTGSGMTPEVMKNMYDPFFTTKKLGEGTGMGLAVVYGIVRSLNGGIDVDSEPGRGTTFTIYLPEVKVDRLETVADEKAVNGGRESILFVDDEVAVTDMNRAILERLGYRVTATTDSRKALDIFLQNARNFDLVITDQAMPGLTGVALAQKMLQAREDVRIILCTGYSDAIAHDKAETVGIRAFLMKPVTKSRLAETVREVLNGSK